MSNPETKVVLGRTFTPSLLYKETWECPTRTGHVSLFFRENGDVGATSILALQSQLRKLDDTYWQSFRRITLPEAK